MASEACWSTRVFDESQTVVIADGKRLVCNCTGDKRNEYASLIAAAPDLLEALKAASYQISRCSSWQCDKDGHRECAWGLSRAAIAKAEGKS